MNNQKNQQSKTPAMSIIQNNIDRHGRHLFVNSWSSTCAMHETESYSPQDAITKIDRLNGNTKMAEEYANGIEIYMADQRYIIAQIVFLSNEDAAQGLTKREWAMYNEDSIS